MPPLPHSPTHSRHNRTFRDNRTANGSARILTCDRPEALPEDLPLRGALQSLLCEAGEDLDQFREALKTWYDDNMDRVASWHKKHTQRAVVVIAAVVAIGANADTPRMARQLSTNDALRPAAVQQSQRVSSTVAA